MSIYYLMYYDIDNKLIKLLLLTIYHFSDDIITFLFLMEYTTMFFSMNFIKRIVIYNKCKKIIGYLQYIKYVLLCYVIYPYYGKCILNISSRVLECIMIFFMSDVYSELNKIAFIRIYSKYKNKQNHGRIPYVPYVPGGSRIKHFRYIFMYYYYDLILKEIDEYFKIKHKISKYYLYVFGSYTLSIISYNTWIYSLYLYYTSLIVANYIVLDNVLFQHTKLKENEKIILIN